MIPGAMATPDPKDLRAVMQQNDALKTFIGLLVARMGGEVYLNKQDFAKRLWLHCETLPDGRVHMVAKHV